MFIKLTRLDNSPIWLNASFIVTVEPRKGGGAIVVPIGDGLDYDVREKPEDVLAMVERAPAPAVVPVPVSDCLTQTPEDVSPEAEAPVADGREDEGALATEKEKKPARKTAAKAKAPAKPRKRAAAKKADEGEVVAPAAGLEAPGGRDGEGAVATADAASEAPDGRDGEGAVATAEAGDVVRDGVHAVVPPSPSPAPALAPAQPPPTDIFAAAAVELTDAQIERLRKMMPRSVRKLANTLMAQFNVLDAMPVIRNLAEGGLFRLEDDHVIWA